MSGLLEPRQVRPGDILAWIRESWSLLWRRPILFFSASVAFHLLAYSVSRTPYISALLVILLGYISLLVLINFADASDHSRAVNLMPNYRMIKRVILSLLLLTIIYILIYLAMAIVTRLIEFDTPSVDYSERELYIAFRWVWPGKLSFTILYIGIVMTSMWFLPPLLALHELDIGDARKLARRAQQMNDWVVFLASYIPFVLIIALTLVTELSYLLNLLLVPFFAIYLYTAYRHVFLGKRENNPLALKARETVLQKTMS